MGERAQVSTTVISILPSKPNLTFLLPFSLPTPQLLLLHTGLEKLERKHRVFSRRSPEAKMHLKGLGGAWDEDRVLLKMAGGPQHPTCPLSFWEDQLCLAVQYLQTLGSVQPQAAPVRCPCPQPAPGPIYIAGLPSPQLDPDVRKNLILPALLLLLKLILEMREQTLHNSHGLDIRYSDKYTPLMSNYHIITFQLARIMMN